MTDDSRKPDAPAVLRPSAVLIADANSNHTSLLDALPLLQASLRQTPDNPGLLLTMAQACHQAGHWDEALGYARLAEAIAPSREGLDLVVDCLYRVGDQDTLDQMMPMVLSRGSDTARGMISLHLVKERRFTQGFALRHALRHTHKSVGHVIGQDDSIPWWDGTPFDGLLLVIAEQALGEELLSSAGLARIAAMGQHAVVECDPRLVPLFSRSFPTLAFVPRFTPALAGARVSGCRKTSASELGFLLSSRDDFTNPTGWLRADPERSARLRHGYRQACRAPVLAGLSWRSFRPSWGPLHKSLQLTDLAPLLARSDCAFVSLQYGDIREELAATADAGVPLPHMDPEMDPVNDVDGFAAQVAAMDLVVTTSNTTAHMAGALGVPTLLMLPTPRGVFPYWCYEGNRTPWYPAMRIVRGDAATDRATFIAAVAAALPEVLPAVPPAD